MVDSPCVAACKLNADKICVGCYRHIDESACWNRLTDPQRQQVLAFCTERRQATDMTVVGAVNSTECQAAKARLAKGEAKLPADPTQS